MKLFETLNNIHFAGSEAISTIEAITFLPDCNGDVDPDEARNEITAFITDECLSMAQESYGPSDYERCKQLCIYGAALFNAIDQHDADPSDHDPKG